MYIKVAMVFIIAVMAVVLVLGAEGLKKRQECRNEGNRVKDLYGGSFLCVDIEGRITN